MYPFSFLLEYFIFLNYLKMKNSKEYISFSLFAFAYCIYEFSRNEYRFNIYDNYLFFKFLEYNTLFFIPYLFYSFCLKDFLKFERFRYSKTLFTSFCKFLLYYLLLYKDHNFGLLLLVIGISIFLFL
jgi:hypothetical protein